MHDVAVQNAREDKALMAPKTKPDAELLAWLKELRQAAKSEKKLKALEKMREEAPPRHDLPTKKPKGKPKRKVR